MSMTAPNTFAIFTAIRHTDDIRPAIALATSLRILGCHRSADLNCVCSREIYGEQLRTLAPVWDNLYVNVTAERHYLNVLCGHYYGKYSTVLYVDPRTVFFTSPLPLFTIPTPASFFNSAYSNYMIHLYSDVLPGVTTNHNHPDYTMGHIHAYGNTINNATINYDVMKQAVEGKYAMNAFPESRVTALDSRFMVFRPDPNFYAFAGEFADANTQSARQYLFGSDIDAQIMALVVRYRDIHPNSPPWKNLVHNYRVPLFLIRKFRGRKRSVIYRKDIMEGLISRMPIYGVESNAGLVDEVLKLTLYDEAKLSDLAPELENVTYVSKEHEADTKKINALAGGGLPATRPASSTRQTPK